MPLKASVRLSIYVFNVPSKASVRLSMYVFNVPVKAAVRLDIDVFNVPLLNLTPPLWGNPTGLPHWEGSEFGVLTWGNETFLN